MRKLKHVQKFSLYIGSVAFSLQYLNPILADKRRLAGGLAGFWLLPAVIVIIIIFNG